MNRDSIVGSSDIPIILGWSSYQSPGDLWAVKTGERPAGPETSAMTRGKLVQPLGLARTLARYPEYTSCTDRDLPALVPALLGHTFEWHGGVAVRHKLYPWATATIDYGLLVDGRLAAINEIKSASFPVFRRKYIGDELPRDVAAQVCWQQEILRSHMVEPLDGLVTVVYGLGDDDVAFYEFDYSERFAKVMLDKAKAFLECVQSRTPPSGACETVAEIVEKKTLADPNVPTKFGDAPPEIVKAVNDWYSTSGDLAKLDERKKEIESTVKLYLGQNGLRGVTGTLADGTDFKLDWQPRGATDYQSAVAEHARTADDGGEAARLAVSRHTTQKIDWTGAAKELKLKKSFLDGFKSPAYRAWSITPKLKGDSDE